MYRPSILIVGKSEADRLARAQKISPKALVTNPTSVDDARELRKLVSLGQSLILNNAHNLTIEAQNALLKTLEEPPENVQIFLLTPDPELLLPTVVSRCVINDLGSLSNFSISAQDRKDLEEVLNWIGLPAACLPARQGRQGSINLKNGFAWSAKIGSDRKAALETVDKLLILTHQHLFQGQALQTAPIRSLLKAKKYLQANTNVRLTMENLFIN